MDAKQLDKDMDDPAQVALCDEIVDAALQAIYGAMGKQIERGAALSAAQLMMIPSGIATQFFLDLAHGNKDKARYGIRVTTDALGAAWRDSNMND